MHAIFVSIGIGLVTVLQAGLNRTVAAKWGLPAAIAINSFLLFLYSLAYWYFCQRAGELSGFRFQWWYLVPPLCGLIIITGIPWAIPQIGALRVFLYLVVGQMVGSLAWDFFIEQLEMDAYRLTGAGLSIAGLIVANWRG